MFWIDSVFLSLSLSNHFQIEFEFLRCKNLLFFFIISPSFHSHILIIVVFTIFAYKCRSQTQKNLNRCVSSLFLSLRRRFLAFFARASNKMMHLYKKREEIEKGLSINTFFVCLFISRVPERDCLCVNLPPEDKKLHLYDVTPPKWMISFFSSK